MYRLIALSLLLSLPLNAQEIIFSSSFENTPPVIISTPVTVGEAGTAYTYEVDATDIDGDLLAYYLLVSPQGMGMDAVTGEISWAPDAIGDYPVTVEVSDGNSGFAQQSWSIDVQPEVIELVPSPIDPTIPSIVPEITRFIYEGEDAVQKGVTPGAIDPVRAAVIRGRVVDGNAVPLLGVQIKVLNHPELGHTVSLEEGRYDLVVNGGGQITLDYSLAGHLPAQRRFNTPSQDYVEAPDVGLVELDVQVTEVSLAEPGIKVASGSLVTDSDGNRQTVMMFEEGTTAEMQFADGTTLALATINVRATEYTVGANGPVTMPGVLPPTSAYTYAVELGVDEAIAAGATSVEFSQPVPVYVDNFLEFPAGTAVPAGYYDRRLGQWIAAPDGLVIDIVSEDSAMANIDIDGSGAAAEPSVLDDLGIDANERTQLALLYDPGDSLWRVAVKHFTPWDFNWPYGLPFGASFPGQPYAGASTNYEGSCLTGGSIIDCQNQVLGERIEIQGTPYTLNYRSNRQRGFAALREANIQLSGDSVPDSLKRIDLDLFVAGQHEKHSYSPASNLDYFFSWDGLDAYGRELSGAQTVSGRISYVYPAVYYDSQETQANSFGVPGDGENIGANRAALEIYLTQDFTLPFSGAITAGQAFSGWSLDIHHSYDPQGRTLYLGDGRQRNANLPGPVVDLLAEQKQCYSDPDGVLEGLPLGETCFRDIYDVDTGLDGNLYMILNECIVRIEPDMTVTRIGGVPEASRPAICNGNFSGTLPLEGVARDTIIGPKNIAAGPDGSVYFTDGNRIGRIRPDGMLEHIAGTGALGANYDTGVATEIDLVGHDYNGLAVGPDGSVYLGQHNWNGYQAIRRIDPNGELTIYYQPGGSGCTANDFCATQNSKLLDLTVGPKGRLYFRDDEAQVWAVETDGALTPIGGFGPCDWSDPSRIGDCGDGGPAIDGQFYTTKGNLDIDRDGSLLLWDLRTVRRITPDGIITRAAGEQRKDWSGQGQDIDGRLAAQIGFDTEWGAVMPDGTLVLAGGYKNLYGISPMMPGFTNDEVAIPSEGGSALYVFNGSARHQRTLNAFTGGIIHAFGYDGVNQLVSVTDAWGNVTTIERNGDGQATAIIAYTGERTTLRTNNDNLLGAALRENGEEVLVEYAAGGLLTQFTDAAGQFSEYTYDASGRLLSATDKSGNTQTFARTGTTNSYQVTRATAEGQSFEFEVSRSRTGEEISLVSNLAGGQMSNTEHRDRRNTLDRLNGAQVESRPAPNPRFGMAASYIESLTSTTPGGLVLTQSRSITADIVDPNDPFSYNEITTTHDVNGQQYTAEFNRAARTHEETTPEGRSYSVTFDDQMQPLTIIGDIGMTPLNFSYTSTGLPSFLSQGDQSLAVTYDDRERPVSIIDAGGHGLQFEWSTDNRLSAMTLPGGETYPMTYDALGRLTTFGMPSGENHVLTWNETGQQTSYQAPGMAIQTVSYDGDRRPTSLTLPSGNMLDFAYDAQGRLASISNPEGTITYLYEGFGASVSQTTFEPDGGGTAESVNMTTDANLMLTQTWGGSLDAVYAYTYNNDFRLTKIQLSSGAHKAMTDLGYDNDGLLTGHGPFTITRDDLAGTTTAVTDGLFSTVYTHDEMGRATGYSVDVSGEIYSVSVILNNTGRVIEKTETVAGVGQTLSYSYTANGQLESVSEGAIVLEQYGYDENGNRTASHNGGATFNSANQVVASEGVSHGYDTDGRLISRGTDIFTYHGDGRVKAATVGGVTVSYQRDATGRRIARTSGGATTLYLYGNPHNTIQLSESISEDGTLSRYFYDESQRLYAIQRGANWFYIGSDGLGSPRIVTDAAGVTLKVVEYDSFGSVLSDSNPDFELPIGFAGGLYDPVTGLVRFGLRDYDPHTGRFTTLDPLALGGGSPNLYLYVNGDPVNQTDRLGLYGWDDFQSDVNGLADALKVAGNLIGDADKASGGAFSKQKSIVAPPGSQYIDGEAASYAYNTYNDYQSLAEPTGGSGTGWLGISAVKFLCKAWDWVPGAGGAAGLYNSKYGPKQENPSSPLDNIWSFGAAALYTFERAIEAIEIPGLGGHNTDPRSINTINH